MSAHAGRHARTQTHADAGPAVKGGMDGDTVRDRLTHVPQCSVRDRLADGDAHTPLSAQGHMRGPPRKAKSTGRRLTCPSPCWRSHRRPWRYCARARRHAHTGRRRRQRRRQTRVAATLREGPTRRRQHTHLFARDDIHPGAKQTATRFAAIGDSPAARDVVGATANRGDTTSAHAGRHAHTQTHADAGVGVKRGVHDDTLRDRLADGDAHTPLSARAPRRGKTKSTGFAAIEETHGPLAAL